MLSQGPSSFAVALASEQATVRLAMDIATILRPGDLVTLSGDLGTGKTTFARALIRELAEDSELDVPSPTFTLLQSYALPRFPVVHVDLYRIGDPLEIVELGLEDTADEAVALIEWPERAAGMLKSDRLEITFTLSTHGLETSREACVTGLGAFASRAARLNTIREFLDEAGFGEAERRHIQGDASFRRYERLTLGRRSAILMDSPARTDGPAVRNGLPYSAIAHLAENVTPFVAVARALRALELSAPEIYAADLAEGLLVLEDLGSEPVVAGDPAKPIEERYAVAVDLLAFLHQHDAPARLPVAPSVDYRLPTYDVEAFLIEAELLLDWYLPQQGSTITERARAEFTGLWRSALNLAQSSPQVLVLRDFHSPNLLWLEDGAGLARVGILDFQDALRGPAAYDVASLLHDARVDVSEAMELGLLGRYAKARLAGDPDFMPAAFVEKYSILAAQRATKILGIFARLDRRDGKPQYLCHQPRIWRYLGRALSHPVLAPLKAWYELHVPSPGQP